MGAFKEFLDDLKNKGELKVITEEVDGELQASAICTMSQRVGGPAVWFDNVKGYPGMPLVGSVYCGPGFIEWPQQTRRMQGRMAMALGLEPDTHYDEVLETVIDRKSSPIRAIEVETGPCRDVVMEGPEVDLYRYPIPKIHDKDGGRYLTSHVVLTRDAESGWTNLGVYRLMLTGRNTLVQGTAPRLTRPRHIQQMVTKYAQKGRPLPFAIAIGPPPEMMMAACLDTPPGTDEYALAGGLGLSSLAVVKARLSDILVPADAEIILEGHIYPQEMGEEGPFGGVSFYTNKTQDFVYRVECITQCQNPILPFVAEGARFSDTMCLFSLLHSAELTTLLRNCGVPVKWVTLPVEARLVLAVVCLAAQPVPGLQGRSADLIFGNSPFVRQVIFVDPDVDSEDLILALTDRVYKANFIRDYCIDPKIDKPLGLTENGDFNRQLTSCMYIDATWRMDRPSETIPRRVTFESCFPEEVQEKVIKNWNEKWKLSPRVWRYKAGTTVK
ncbi:MAG: UbiD family decarboxylase [Desulforudis sp.]|jgi:4-hydroxy-3-polyprenylbenzoate decarboxylase|nr:MAG: UbiD family decarboxylase [Desulforudis sp.]